VRVRGTPHTGNASGEFRVTLHQPGAVTHALNTSARYVVLQHGPVTVNTPPSLTTINVFLPVDIDNVPPGYYLLTVVSSIGVPSRAAWVKVEP
jgi:hypothetical protein